MSKRVFQVTSVTVVVLAILAIVVFVVLGYITPKSWTSTPDIGGLNIDRLQQETASWETYTNKRFSFSVNHPANWRAPTDFGGVMTPGGTTYQINGATAYEYVFTFIPPRIDDFPARITAYEPSDLSFNTTTIREKVIARMWSHFPESARNVTRKTINTSAGRAMFVSVVINDARYNLRRDFVFFEKDGLLYTIEHSGSSSSKEFELFYKSFTFSQETNL